MKNTISLTTLFLILSIFWGNTAHAGWLKKALIGGALVGGGYVAGKSNAEASNDGPLFSEIQTNTEGVSVSQAERNRLNAIEKVLWKKLKQGDYDSVQVLSYADKLNATNDLTKLDAAAFAYAELGQKDKALAIYQEKIVNLFRATTVSEIEIEIYDRRYTVLEQCEEGRCVSGL